MTEPDYRSNYLSRSLVAYIGNKRSLLPFLGAAFARCAEALERSGGGFASAGAAPRLLDPFAGSGGVSRLARAMGFRVLSNDREVYAATIARCRLLLDPASLETVFSAEGGSVKAFSAVNAFACGASPDAASATLASSEARAAWREAFMAAEREEPYIARHYAPADTETADWRTERLFYTAENAVWLDRAREAVERRFGGEGGRAKDALVEALIYEAATRTNTSGVFKACHRGFGGHGGDALDRIKSTMRLQPPDLVYGSEAEVGCMDAADFCAKRPAEIAYLDPPYNQHQYGSNYHLLTTIARWDKPPVSLARAPDGFLLDRSGIRSDWLETRSDFCRRGRAAPAFIRLLDSIDARFILLSYNDGGIVPLDELADLLSAYGELRIESRPYVAYRGGKQSALRMERTSELLFVVERRPRGRVVDAAFSAESVRETLRRIDLAGRSDALLRGRFHPDGAERAFATWPGKPPLSVSPDGRATLLLAEPTALTQLEDFVTRLEACACVAAGEAFDLALAAFEAASAHPIEKPKEAARLRAFLRDALAFLRKLAFKKYSMEYRPRSARLREILLRLSAAGTAGVELESARRLLGSLDRLDAQSARRGV